MDNTQIITIALMIAVHSITTTFDFRGRTTASLRRSRLQALVALLDWRYLEKLWQQFPSHCQARPRGRRLHSLRLYRRFASPQSGSSPRYMIYVTLFLHVERAILACLFFLTRATCKNVIQILIPRATAYCTYYKLTQFITDFSPFMQDVIQFTA